MPWYKTGTVSVTQNSNAVIGTGTAFIANSRVGDGFRGPDGRWYEVTNIASNTALSISPNYEGPTAAGGFYSIMPVQGYQKDLSDRVREILNDYGEKLAALGTTGNYDILPPSKGGTGITDLSVFIEGLLSDADAPAARSTLSAAKSGANDDITSLTSLTTALSVGQGGTGGSTPALGRAGLELKSAATADILGTASQSSGIPTGSLMERGSNSAGEYAKFADGTLICWRVAGSNPGVSVNMQRGSLYSSQDLGPDAFPYNFSNAPYVGGFAYSAGMIGWVSFVEYATNTAWPKWVIFSPYSSNWIYLTVNFFAIGRWY